MATPIATFQQTFVYFNKAPVDVILQDLKTIRTIGQQLDLKIKKMGRRFGWLILLDFASFFGGFFCLSYAPAIILCAVAGIPVLIALGFRFNKWRKRAFDHRLEDLLYRVIGFVSTDMAPTALMGVYMDLRSHHIQEKFNRDGKVGPWKVKYYVDPCLRVVGRLMDGTSFRLDTLIRTQLRKKTVKSAGGKYKTKSKLRESTVLSLRLKFNATRYPGVSSIPDAQAALQLGPQITLRRFQLTDDSAMAAVRMPAWVVAPGPDSQNNAVSGSHAAAMLFLGLFQILNLAQTARRMRQKQS